jgi:hypothetical protein
LSPPCFRILVNVRYKYCSLLMLHLSGLPIVMVDPSVRGAALALRLEEARLSPSLLIMPADPHMLTVINTHGLASVLACIYEYEDLMVRAVNYLIREHFQVSRKRRQIRGPIHRLDGDCSMPWG